LAAFEFLGPDVVTALMEGMIMFAVIQTGGKQYKVAKDDIIVIEKLDGEAGDKVSFDNVLLSGKGGDVKVGHSWKHYYSSARNKILPRRECRYGQRPYSIR